MKLLLNKKIVAFIITLQEAFVALIPFIIFSAFLTLLNIFFNYFHWNFIPKEFLHSFTKTINSYISLIATISISFFIAKRIKVSEIMAIILSIVTFVSILVYENNTYPITLPYGFSPATIFSPLISTLFLKFFYPKLSLHINITDGNYHIYRFFNYIFVFFAAYLASLCLYISVDAVMDIVIEKYNPLTLNLPDIILLAIRDFLVQIFWFFGIHGEHMVNALFGKEVLFKHIFPNLTYGEFHRMFVNIGGAGVGLSLLIALFLHASNKTVKTLAKLSAPFVFFNINDIIIFLIVVFNRFLFLPFVFLPIMNLFLAYLFIHTVHLNYDSIYLVWSTPVFADAYLKTHSFAPVAFQVFLIAVDTMIYSYFIKKFFQIQSVENKKHILQTNLGIKDEIRAKKDIKAFLANQEMIEANTKLNEIIDNLNPENLFIYYQPKIDLKNNKALKYEALIRYNDNGIIKGPFFLDTIEKAGLAPIIDIWVAKKVKNDLEKWRDEGFFPEVAVNLHPDTLKSNDAINIILNVLKEKHVTFEVIERSFVNKNAKENIKKLKELNYGISIDDFGVGYSSLETIIKYNFDELKLDKSLIDEIETERGYLVCKNVIHLCKDLNIKVVAEGVEKKTALNILSKLNVDYIQGYYFSRAIPFEKVKKFSEEFSLDDF